MIESKGDIIIYNTVDGKASIALYAVDGTVWMNQNQLAELFDTSKQNIGQHIKNILSDSELAEDSVVKNFFTTASDGKEYNVSFYSLDMILAIGFRVRSKRGTQFRQWANRNLGLATKTSYYITRKHFEYTENWMHESEYYDTFDQLRRKYNINSEYDIIFEENSSTGEYLLMNWGYDGDNDNGYFSTYPDASWTNGSREYKYDKKIHYDFR